MDDQFLSSIRIQALFAMISRPVTTTPITAFVRFRILEERKTVISASTLPLK